MRAAIPCAAHAAWIALLMLELWMPINVTFRVRDRTTVLNRSAHCAAALIVAHVAGRRIAPQWPLFDDASHPYSRPGCALISCRMQTRRLLSHYRCRKVA